MGLQEIEISDLSFTYENRTSPALNKVSLSIEPREFVLLAGASGSGKSTLIKCVNGLIPHRYVGEYSGQVRIRGKAVPDSRFLQLSLTVGTVLQEADKQLVSSIVEDDVAFGPGNLALPRQEIQRRVKNSLESMDILDLRERSIFAISGGQKQRLAIADVLAMEPDILLFDEPLANLDSNGVRLMQGIFRTLHETGKTIVVSEHRTEEVLRSKPTRVVVIDDGKLLADSQDPKVLVKFRDVLKVPAEYALEDVAGASTPMMEPQPLSRPATSARDLIQVENLTFEYSGGVKALTGISFGVHEGERVALLGNNGAGKSTLALSLVGLLKPTSGRILIEGEDAKKLDTSEIAKTLCLVFQSPFSMLFARTVRDELSFGPKNLGYSSEQISSLVPETARRCSISHLLDGSPFASSFGEKKRICVGSVLTIQPKCIILDEPTAGQDYRSYSNFMNFICSLGEHVKSFIVITHDPDLAIEYTDRAIVLNDGKIIADGPTRKVLADQSILKEGAIRETSQIELSLRVTGGKEVLRLSDLALRRSSFASS
jgi:energy-coupling factor transport system ATP-binding protein